MSEEEIKNFSNNMIKVYTFVEGISKQMLAISNKIVEYIINTDFKSNELLKINNTFCPPKVTINKLSFIKNNKIGF